MYMFNMIEIIQEFKTLMLSQVKTS